MSRVLDRTDTLQSRFVRSLEVEYDRCRAAYKAAGIDPEESHSRALQDVRRLGRQALEVLRRRGLFPWGEADHA